MEELKLKIINLKLNKIINNSFKDKVQKEDEISDYII